MHNTHNNYYYFDYYTIFFKFMSRLTAYNNRKIM